MNNCFQKLLWNISGAELPILEKCQTDHKKFSAIGATILMTAFIALCAGTSAAWYFTQKGDDSSGIFGWSLAFGFLWATLIFCIDRSLVITLKKDPTKKHQKFIIPLVSRALLAIVVAFMVSIPLELVIFEDYIIANQENFEANQIAVLGQQLKDNSGEDVMNKRITGADATLNRLSNESKKLGGDIDALQAKINNLEVQKERPNSSAYNSAKARYNSAQRGYSKASANYNTENRKRYPSSGALNSYRSSMNSYKAAMTAAKRDMNIAAQAWRNEKQTAIDALIPQRDAKIEDKKKKDEFYGTTLDSKLKDTEKAQKAAEERKIKEESKQEKLANGNHFIQNFQILEYAVWQTDKNGNLTDKTQLMFLWLVRLLFFIVEILPTIVKIVSPIGSYERMVYAEEKSLEEYLESDEYTDKIRHVHELALSTQEELQQEQHDTEIELKKNILEKIKLAQLEIAELAIEKWKETEKTKLSTSSESVTPTGETEETKTEENEEA